MPKSMDNLTEQHNAEEDLQRRIAQLENELATLEPLREILPHAAQLKHYLKGN